MSRNWNKERKDEWWIKVVGYVPTEEEIALLVREEPGLALLIADVFNPKSYWKRHNQQKK